MCGVQAQDIRASGLALRARVPGLVRGDVDAAELVRTWTVRGTVHLIPSSDRGWLHALCAPRFGSGGSPKADNGTNCGRWLARTPPI